MSFAGRALLASLSLGAVLFSGCGVTGTPVTGAPVTGSPAAPAAFTAKYLYTLNYVIDAQNQIVVSTPSTTDFGATVGSLLPPEYFYATSLTTDSSGQIYVSGEANKPGFLTSLPLPVTEVLVYPPNSIGSVAPSRTLTVPLFPDAIAVDATGQLYVGGYDPAQLQDVVDVYAASATAASAPLRSILLPSSGGIGQLAVDGSGNLYVHYYDSNLLQCRAVMYSPAANGAATPARTLGGLNEATSDGVGGIAVNAAGNVFVSREDTSSAIAVVEFAPAGSGNDTPIATLTPAPNTVVYPGIAYPGALRFDSAGTLYFSGSVPPGGPISDDAYDLQSVYTFLPDSKGGYSASYVLQALGTTAQLAIE